MKTLYISPIFKNLDGTFRKFMIAAEGIKTHAARDAAVLKMMELGGISAPDTPEVQKLMSKIRSAKRKIEKNNWYSTPVL